jgi:phospholipid/cholesterol/gamma-HCH transport system substrate-binding protein
MKRGTVEAAVGIFVLIGIVCIAYLTIRLGRMEFFADSHYVIEAKFQSVGGLKSGSSVQMAGVPVGKVEQIYLDKDLMVAVVRMKIQNEVGLADDTIASVKTSGLIGDKYINLTPGGSEDLLNPGDVIVETESALDIEELISKYVFGNI